jgi:hypothetical protein
MKQKFEKLLPYVPFVLLCLCAVVLHYVFPGVPGLITCGVPMIGAMDSRIAYANAFKNLHMKATQNGKIAVENTPWYPNRGNVILSQSYLRSEVKLSASKNTYQFGILNNQITNGQTAIFNSEKRLTLQDVFYVAQIGYYFRLVASGLGNTVYSSHLFSHPPGQISNGTNTNTLDALWQGELQLNVNNRVVEPGWDLWRHYETPQTQYPVFESAVDSQQYPVNDEHYGGQSGVYPVEPMWILNGAFDNVMNVSYYDGLSNIGLSGDVHMVIIMRGILAQNCSKLMEPGTINPS